MPMTRLRAACLGLLVGTFLWPALRTSAQSFPMTLEGYSVASQMTSAPVRSTVALAAPYRAVGVGTTLQVLDESDPLNPRVVSQVTLPSPANDLIVYGSYLYVAAGASGLITMDVSNPLTPKYVSGIKTSVPALGLAVNEGGRFVYLCGGTDQVHVVNVKDPYHPKAATYLFINKANIFGLAVTGRTLIVAAGPKGLVVYNLDIPSAPVRVKRFKDLKAANRISVSGSLVAVAEGDLGLALVNFSTWKTPVLKGSLAMPVAPLDCQFLADPAKVAVALGDGGYDVVDVADASNPVSLAQPASPSPVTRILPGSRTYMVCGAAGLYWLDASIPAQPVTHQALAGQPVFGAVAVLNNTAFISRNNAVEVWDFQDPAHPAMIGSVATPLTAVDFLLSGNLLMASCQTGGVLFFDVTNPASPVRIATITVGGSAGQLALAGNLLALADGSDGVYLIDISVPAAPVLRGTWNDTKTVGFVGGAAFSAPTTLWVRHSAKSLVSLDVSDPTAPKTLGSLSLDGNPGRLYFHLNYLYIMSGFTGWPIVDPADPAKPKKVNTMSTNGAIQASFQGSTMLFCDGNAGFREYDLTDPTNPVLTSFFGAPTFSYQGAFLANGARLLSCREGGLWCLTTTSCAGTDLLLPCDGDTLARFFQAAFIWAPVAGDSYSVQISKDPGFPKGKIYTSEKSVTDLKVPFWQPGDTAWSSILHKAKKSPTLYWRVVYHQGSHRTFSETRSLTIP